LAVGSVSVYGAHRFNNSAGGDFQAERGWKQTWMGMDLQYETHLYLCKQPSHADSLVLEGLATVVAGAASFWIVQDFPDTARFLTEAEGTFIIRRLQGDDQFSAGGEKLRFKYIKQSLTDWKTWITSMWYYFMS